MTKKELQAYIQSVIQEEVKKIVPKLVKPLVQEAVAGALANLLAEGIVKGKPNSISESAPARSAQPIKKNNLNSPDRSMLARKYGFEPMNSITTGDPVLDSVLSTVKPFETEDGDVPSVLDSIDAIEEMDTSNTLTEVFTKDYSSFLNAMNKRGRLNG